MSNSALPEVGEEQDGGDGFMFILKVTVAAGWLTNVVP
jgi:hypothetical protein